MNLNPISLEWRCRHVVTDVVLGFFASLAVTATIVYFIPPAWAVSIPVGNLFVLDLGDLPPWIAALVGFAIWWDARKARKSAAEAASSAAQGVAIAAQGVALNKELAVKVDGVLKDRDKASEAKGEAKEKKVGEATAEVLAEGQRQGRENARESMAAATAAAPVNVPVAATVTGKQSPVPVADDKTGAASVRVAEATERMADAAEVKANKQTKPGD